MAGANSNISLVGLDFNAIKNNLKTYLQSQDTFKDYNFDGSSLSVILDLLAYNTQYNAFYLNMVANEMFLDTALQRSSVVSHAKLLNYTPKSAVAPTAYVNIVCSNVTASDVTLPAYSNFLSESINGRNYNFVNTETVTLKTANNSVTFEDVQLKQGISTSYRFTVDSVSNPTYTFEVPDNNIDTSTLRVTIQKSSSNSYIEIYDLSQDYITINGNSKVYFLQEALNGNYEIYFGDDIIGKKLEDGNIVITDYITTEGVASSGANNFVLLDNVSGFERNIINSNIEASQGQDKESIDSIKFTAPKSYVAQKRAITKEDYIYLLQQNSVGLSFDAVNVWGGEENIPPTYGEVYVAIKPKGGYVLTENQKQKIVNDILMPVSVMTVTPKLVDIDYVYIILNAKVFYDPKRTNLTAGQISETVKQGVIDYCNGTLNTFNSTFVVGDLINYVQRLNQSIIAVDFDVFLQKRFIPELNKIQNYTVNFGAAIERSVVGTESLTFEPSISQYDDRGNFYSEVYIEESPDLTTNVDSITIINGGSGYTNPTITILGDGTGAKAAATVKNGVITDIVILSGGSGYTQSIAQISDSTGSGAVVSVVLQGNYGDLRSYYFVNGVKNILSGATHTSRVGYANYSGGTVTLTSFSPTGINSTDGIYKVTGYAESRILNSSMDRIITLDVNDPESISVEIIAK